MINVFEHQKGLSYINLQIRASNNKIPLENSLFITLLAILIGILLSL